MADQLEPADAPATPAVLPPRVDPLDEGAHTPDVDDRLWSESYYLDGISDDGAVGVYARLGDTPNLGVALMSFAITRPGMPSIILSDAAAPLPVREGTRYTIDASDYTAVFENVTPLQVSTFTLQGTAYRYDDEGAILRGEAGTAVPVKADLRWETDGLDYRWSITTRYEVPCRVTGTIEIDGERFEFAGDGQRDHSWASRDWWGMPWMWNAFRLHGADGRPDGTKIHTVVMRGLDMAFGYVQSGDELIELSAGSADQEYDGDGHISQARFALEDADLEFTVTPTAYGNLLLVSEAGKVAHFIRAMADFQVSDGRTGRGWIEWEYVLD